MIPKLIVFIIVAVTVIGLDATCPTLTDNVRSVTNISDIVITTIQPVIISTTPIPYHPCPRSMNTYLTKTLGYRFRCSLGYRANECANNGGCAGKVNNYCCQQSNGCNKCVGK
jgi:hypothetical protein